MVWPLPCIYAKAGGVARTGEKIVLPRVHACLDDWAGCIRVDVRAAAGGGGVQQQPANAAACEIVFASSDSTQEEFDEYFEQMPWKAVPFSRRDIKNKVGTAPYIIV